MSTPSTERIYAYRSCRTHQKISKKSNILKIYARLCKVRISSFAALSALTGSILLTGEITSATLIAMTGVFLLACGAGALNQYQEREIDARMNRTKRRPIPSGNINPSRVFQISAALCMSGFLVLALNKNLIVCGLGLFALFWYKLVYTTLKKKTAFAAVPGAVVGAVPPAIGWLAAGGSLTDPALLPLCFFFFMWQIPHFWLLLFTHEEDFKKSDLPVLFNKFATEQFGRITFIWTLAAALSVFMMPLFGIALTEPGLLMLCVASVLLVRSGVSNLQLSKKGPAYKTAFKHINAYMLIVMIILNAQRLINL